ncbi:MAG: AMP-binding protein, partial [Bauldia litoralis]
MTETVHPVTDEWAKRAYVDNARYEEMYQRSVADPDGFWAEQAKSLDWIKPFTKVKNTSFDAPGVSIKWFEDGELNVSANCTDRHLATRGDQTAILWEPDDPTTEGRTITYRELHDNVCRLANVLKSHGVQKGDRVTIYMPMIPEVAYAMLACARIGAIHSVVFAGFSAEALAGRIEDCRSGYVITADEGRRGGRTVPLKVNTDEAVTIAEAAGARVNHVIVVKHTGADVAMKDGRDVWYHEVIDGASADCP